MIIIIASPQYTSIALDLLRLEHFSIRYKYLTLDFQRESEKDAK